MNAAIATAIPEPRTYRVLSFRQGEVQEKLQKLEAKLTKKGLPCPTWAWGEVTSKREETALGWEEVSRVALVLSGEFTVSFGGWTFLAAIDHIEGGSFVRVLPGMDLPEEYLTRGAVCDHCKASRRRHSTFVVRHEDGRVLQVGSTCVADFLGSHEADTVASSATMLAEVCGEIEDSYLGGFDVVRDGRVNLRSRLLPTVAALVRVSGWVPRSQAQDGSPATCDLAMRLIDDPKKFAALGVTEEEALADRAEADKAVDWALALTDAEIGSAGSDYLHNVRVVARTGLVDHKTLGVGASILVAYQRWVGRERAKAQPKTELDVYVGTVGKREAFGVCVLDFVTGYATDYGYTTVLKFRTATGALMVWKASNSTLGRDDVGKSFEISGMVKEHALYQGKKQTIINRCKVVEVVKAEVA